MSWVWYHLGYHLLRHIKQFNDLFHSQRIQPPIRRMKIPPSLSVFSKSKHHFNVLGYLFLWPIMIICHQIIIPNQARILSRNRRIVAAHRETKWNENENRRKPAPCSNRTWTMTLIRIYYSAHCIHDTRRLTSLMLRVAIYRWALAQPPVKIETMPISHFVQRRQLSHRLQCPSECDIGVRRLL